MGALAKIEGIVRATEFIGQSSGLQFSFSSFWSLFKLNYKFALALSEFCLIVHEPFSHSIESLEAYGHFLKFRVYTITLKFNDLTSNLTYYLLCDN